MTGFSLGGGSGGGGGNPPNEIPQESFFLYRNEEIAAFNSTKGFELWQQHIQRQQQQSHHHHHPHHQQQDIIYTSGLDAGPSRSTNISDESSSRAHMMMRGGSGGGSSSGKSCQDCGNQAKKDCLHMRCRTCCKSRGFQCPTHVKSTWVPASRRRERQQQLQAVQLLRGGGGDQISKRLRENPNPTPPTSTRLPTTTTTAAGLQVGNFPAEVNSQAVFRCVRVSAMSEAEDEYAYHAAVSIGGHVFKGLLYDQGLQGRYAGAETSSGTLSQQRNLMCTNTDTNNAGGASNAVMDPSSLYPTPLNAFVAGTQFFPHPRS